MQSLQEILCRSLTLFHQRQLCEAESLLRRGLDEHADAASLWQLLGLVQNDSGAWREALTSLERASHISPLEPMAAYTLAMCYLWSERRELAILMLRQLATSSQTPTSLLPMVASSLGNLQQHALALAACRQLLRRDSNRHDALFGIGFYLRRLGLPRAKSIAAFRRAHTLAPSVGLYRIVLAGLLEEQGEIDEAWDLLRGTSLAGVECPGAVRRMMRLFESVGDATGLSRCQQRLEQLNDTDCDCDQPE